MYHYVREPEEWKGSVPISPKAFEEQINQLSKTHEFVLPDDLNKKTSKPKCILTFDDATKDQYEIAFDIMKRKGIPGYFTVMSGPLVEKEVPVFHLVHAALSLVEEEYLWDELRLQLTPKDLHNLDLANKTYAYEQSQLRRYIKYTLNFILDSKQSKNFLEKMVYSHFGSKQKFIDYMYINIEEFQKMKQAGMTLGVHCVHHTPFDGRAEEYYKNEIAPCAKFIQEQFDIKPAWYTPPFGGGEKKMLMMENLKDRLLSEGYKGAFTTDSGIIDDTSSFWFNRFDCNKIFTGDSIGLALENVQ
ncbi:MULTISPECIES: polysaccharide deacetylase family protein [Cohnella]|uniref:polysaccharide deacetylase family protein n=1 Tax=Cohnella TaxID=329857 RepID=UPI00257C2209|nr:polysaccharide deacetylase family protein [Cohnella sp.]